MAAFIVMKMLLQTLCLPPLILPDARNRTSLVLVYLFKNKAILWQVNNKRDILITSFDQEQ